MVWLVEAGAFCWKTSKTCGRGFQVQTAKPTEIVWPVWVFLKAYLPTPTLRFYLEPSWTWDRKQNLPTTPRTLVVDLPLCATRRQPFSGCNRTIFCWQLRMPMVPVPQWSETKEHTALLFDLQSPIRIEINLQSPAVLLGFSRRWVSWMLLRWQVVSSLFGVHDKIVWSSGVGTIFLDVLDASVRIKKKAICIASVIARRLSQIVLTKNSRSSIKPINQVTMLSMSFPCSWTMEAWVLRLRVPNLLRLQVPNLLIDGEGRESLLHLCMNSNSQILKEKSLWPLNPLIDLEAYFISFTPLE